MLKDALGGYRGTVGELDRIVDGDPLNAMAWFDRANARSGAGDYRGAIADYGRALELGIRFRERIAALGNRAMARMLLGDLAGAAADFSEIIESSPAKASLLATAYRKRAAVREQLGDSAGSAADRVAAEGVLALSEQDEDNINTKGEKNYVHVMQPVPGEHQGDGLYRQGRLRQG